jgi:predicted HTH domain antitoxin
MSLVISDDVLRTANISAMELQREIAVMLFQQERLTLGQASAFARKNQLEFQHLLASRQIAVHYGVQEFMEDKDTLRGLGQI